MALASCGGEEAPKTSPDEAPITISQSPIVPSAEVGALPGTFQVTGDGAAMYEIPLVVPPGRAGIEPALSLVYTSRGGNDIAGTGWSLSGLSQIARCERNSFRDGVVRPVQYAPTDALCLDGVRLVQIASGGAVVSPECTSSQRREYRTEPDMFAKIVACDEDARGALDFIVYTKDGRIHRYGDSAASGSLEHRPSTEVALPDINGNSGSVQQRRPVWLLAAVQDRAGNYMTYRYGHADGAQWLEWWLERIEYTGFGATAPNRKVSFGYDTQRLDPWSTYQRGLELKHTRLLTTITMEAPKASDLNPDVPAPNPVPAYVRRYRLVHGSSTTTKRALLTSVQSCDGFNRCLPATTFTYSSAAPMFLAADASGAVPASSNPMLFGTDANGDGKDDVLHGTSTHAIVRLSTGDALAPLGAAISSVTAGIIVSGRGPEIPYDYDRDGFTDLIRTGCSAKGEDDECIEWSRVTSHARGDGTFASPLKAVLWRIDDPQSRMMSYGQLVDLDGDRKADAASGLVARLNFLSSANEPFTLPRPIPRTPGGGSVRYLDADGDGALDVLAPYFHGSTARYDALHVRGTPAGATVEATPLGFDIAPGNCQLFADVNGDGAPDLVDVKTGANVRLGRGDGRFTLAASWAPTFTGTSLCSTLTMPGYPWLGFKQTGVYPVDYNLDGKQDLLVIQPLTGLAGETARILVSTGTSFDVVPTNIVLAQPSWTCGSTNAAPEATTLDANGDGRFDVAFVCAPKPSNGSAFFRVYTQQANANNGAASHADLLLEVRNQSDTLVRKIDYGLLTDPAVYARTTPHVQALPVVATEWIDGGAGPVVSARHTYEGGSVTNDGEGWLGFRRHTVIDPRNGPGNETTHRTTYATGDAQYAVTAGAYLEGRTFHPFKGQIVEEISHVTVNGIVHATRTKRTPAAVGETFPGSGFQPKSYFVYPRDVVVETFHTPASSFSADSPGVALTRTATSIQVNACGDPISEVIDRGSGVIVTTTRTFSATPGLAYCHLGASWLDLLTFESKADSRAPTRKREVQYAYDPLGRLRDRIQQPNGGADEKLCTTVVQRDGFGNPSVVDATPGGCARTTLTRTTRISYEVADGIHATQTINPVGHVAKQRVDPGVGVVYLATDANGEATMRQHDSFGRLVRTDRPDGTDGFPSTVFVDTKHFAPSTSLPASRCNTDGFTTSSWRQVVQMTTSTGGESIACIDRLGRTARAISKTGQGAYAYVDTQYVPGFPERVLRVTRPHAANTTPNIAALYTYDAAGRVTKTCHTGFGQGAGGASACSTVTYDKLKTDTCDESGIRHRRVTTPFGALESTSIFPSATATCATSPAATTRFAYGAFDKLVTITDALGNQVTQEHDASGRRTKLLDNDVGSVTTKYTAFGEIREETNGRGQVTTMTYDRASRPTNRTVVGEGTDTFVYDPIDAVGALGEMTRGSVKRTLEYDTRGRPTAATLAVDGDMYRSETTYDPQGRVAITASPDIEGLGPVRLRNRYNPHGSLERIELGVRTCSSTSQCQSGQTCSAWTMSTSNSVNLCTRDIWRRTGADIEDRVTGESFGVSDAAIDPVSATRTYQAGYLSSLVTRRGTTTLQSNTYTYLHNESLASRTDNLVTGATETFLYDGADRLTSATRGARVHSYQYDAIGNLTSANDIQPVGGACPSGVTYRYTKTTPWGAVGPHALTNVVCGPYDFPLRQDASGNHVSGLDAADGLQWTSFGKLAVSSGVFDAWQFAYDAAHQRVLKTRTSGPSPYHPWTKIVSAGALERRFKEGGEQNILTIPAGSATLQLIWDWNGSSGTLKLQYHHPDRLGSPELVVDNAGAVIEKKSFDVWGNPRASDMAGLGPWPSATDLLLAGHRADVGVTIGGGWTFIDMGGRIYSPLLKRFWSPDPIVQAPAFGPSWNRYSYVLNNPLKYTDPTGHQAARTGAQRQADWNASVAVFGTMFASSVPWVVTNNEYVGQRAWEAEINGYVAAIRKSGWESQLVMYRGDDGKDYIVQRGELVQSLQTHLPRLDSYEQLAHLCDISALCDTVIREEAPTDYMKIIGDLTTVYDGVMVVHDVARELLENRFYDALRSGKVAAFDLPRHPDRFRTLTFLKHIDSISEKFEILGAAISFAEAADAFQRGRTEQGVLSTMDGVANTIGLFGPLGNVFDFAYSGTRWVDDNLFHFTDRLVTSGVVDGAIGVMKHVSNGFSLNPYGNWQGEMYRGFHRQFGYHPIPGSR